MKDKLHLLMIVILATLIAIILALSGKLIEIKNRTTQAEQLDIAKSNLAYSFEYDLNIETDTSDYDYSKFNRIRTKTKVERVQEKSPEVKQEVSSEIIKIASEYLGIPYVWGGTTPSGFDCSGFTSYVFRNFGVNLPRVSRSQATVGAKVDYANLQPGDLVFFGSGSISHVGIYIGNGNMVHSPRPGKSVEISSMRYHKFITARRVL